MRQPAAAADELVLHHGDMGGRPAEGRGAQAEEEDGQFAQARPRAALGRFRPGGRWLRIGPGTRIAHGTSAGRGWREIGRAAGRQIIIARQSSILVEPPDAGIQ